MKPIAAALQGAQEIGFTVLTISISLVAVFIPLLMMGGIVGTAVPRIFGGAVGGDRGFDVVSLTTTPMMCAHLLKEHESHGRIYRAERARLSTGSSESVRADAATACCGIPRITLLVLAATIGLNVYLFVRVPKGFFPQQDNGRMQGTVLGDQDTSFQAMQGILLQMVKMVRGRPGRGHRDRVHRRQRRRRKHHQPGAHEYSVEAAVPSGRFRCTTSSSGCGRKLAGCAARHCICRPRRTCGWAGDRARRCISSPCAATICRIW